MAISLSSGVRQALFSLQQTSTLALDGQLKLSTGRKVNSAFDNPSSYFTAAGLNSRANDLSQLLDNIGQSIKTVEAADNGTKALQTLVDNARSVASQALTSASSTSRVQGTAALTGSTLLTSLGFVGSGTADTITIKAGSTAGTAFTVSSTTTVQDLIDAVNNDSALTGKAVASLNDGGNLVIDTVDNSQAKIATTGNATAISGLLGSPTGVTSATASGTTTLTAAAGTTNSTRKSLAAQFDALLQQIDQTSKDAGYNGVNLLGGDSLRIQFNEFNTSSITITGVKFDAAGLGVKVSSNGFQSDADIKKATNQLIAASSTLRDQSRQFGSNLAVVKNRQEFTKSTINTLNAGADDLVLADQNEEAAKLTTLNTRQQLAATALSLANQANQSVLRLFQ